MLKYWVIKEKVLLRKSTFLVFLQSEKPVWSKFWSILNFLKMWIGKPGLLFGLISLVFLMVVILLVRNTCNWLFSGRQYQTTEMSHGHLKFNISTKEFTTFVPQLSFLLSLVIVSPPTLLPKPDTWVSVSPIPAVLLCPVTIQVMLVVLLHLSSLLLPMALVLPPWGPDAPTLDFLLFSKEHFP